MRLRSLCAALAIAAAALPIPARAQDEPPLVPLTAFFANPKAAWEHRISPDGTRLAWVAMQGHGINRTPNRLAFFRAVERFLARHLGGRDGGDRAE